MLRFLNDHTLGLAAAEQAVIPTFTIYPEPGVGSETARCLQAGGRCVKVHLQVGGFDATDPLLDEAWGRLEEAGTPVVLHAAAVADGSGNEHWCGPGPVRRLLGRFPGLCLVIAHLGAPDHDAFVALAETHPGVWLDTAMVFTDPPYLGPSPLHLVERMAGLGDRIVFGSDFPTIPPCVRDAGQRAGRARAGRDLATPGAVGQRDAALRFVSRGVPHWMPGSQRLPCWSLPRVAVVRVGPA